jgi:CMP-N-acetylneuraminic acid synthetase
LKQSYLTDSIRPIAVIPAKSKSKGIENKNLQIINGKPLIEYSIQAAKKAGVYSIVSTESSEIATKALDCGADHVIKRPEELCLDGVHAVHVIVHAINFLDVNPDTPVFMLLPTSPCRSYRDVYGALQYLKEYESVIGICEVCPENSLRYVENYGMYPVVPNLPMNAQRQDVRPVYRINGAIFLTIAHKLRTNVTFHLERCFGYLMSKIASIDINTYEDLAIAQSLANDGKVLE